MVMFPVVALVLSVLFEGLDVDATIVLGTVMVLAGNLFVLNTRAPVRKKSAVAVAGVMPVTARAMDVE